MAELLDHASALAKHQIVDAERHNLIVRTPRIAAFLGTFVALLVLLGWAIHDNALVTILPGFPAMAQTTATAFLLSSICLWLQQKRSTQQWLVRTALLLALAVFLIGLSTLLHYSFLLLGHGSLPVNAAGRPINRMSPNSAINFVLLGLALLLADVRGRGERWPAQALALIVCLDALVAVIGQCYGITMLYGLSHFLGMAVPTAVLFLMLSIGVLLVRPNQGFLAILLGDDAAGRAARRFLPLALAVPVVLGGVSLISQRMNSTNNAAFAYLLIVASVGLLGWLVWGNVLALAAQVRRSQSYERQVAELERKHVEDALQGSEERLLFAVEGAGIGTWRWDTGSQRLIWSNRGKALLGQPVDAEMTQSQFFECIYPEDRASTEPIIALALRDGSGFNTEYRVRWPDGTIHWLAAKGRGYEDAQGRFLRSEGTIQNIDDRKAAETAVREAAERQKTLLRDVLFSVTGGRLRLVEAENELPEPLQDVSDPMAITPFEGLAALRQQVKRTAIRLGFSDARWQNLVTAASEGGMNAVTHGGVRGEAIVSSNGRDIVQVRIQDWGGGIKMENLPQATLSRGWSSTTSLGHGLVMILQSIDRLWLLTGPGGTTVVMEQDREEPLPIWL